MKLAANATAPTPAICNLSDYKPGNAYETNYNHLMANHCREEYSRIYAIKQALVAAHVSGFLDITVRSATGSVTIPMIGEKNEQRAHGFFIELAEALGDKMSKLEHDIVRYEQDSEGEEAAEREGTGQRAETFAFCLPMRPLSDEEFLAMPAEARRHYDEHRAEQVKAA